VGCLSDGRPYTKFDRTFCKSRNIWLKILTLVNREPIVFLARTVVSTNVTKINAFITNEE
jgi:hypothetical protein